MSTRSSVAFAVRAELLNKLPEDVQYNIVNNWFGPTADDEGKHTFNTIAEDQKDGWYLFYTSDISWSSVNEEIQALYTSLKSLNPAGDQYRIVEACYDYPTSDDGNAGIGDDPWNVRPYVSVSITANGVDLSD